MKRILITGASTGIGLDTAQYLAANGFLVYAGVRKTEDFEKLNSIHDNIEAVYLDILNDDHISDFLESAKEIDILFNNAGIAVGGPLELLPIEKIRQQFEVNVIAQINITQKLLPLLRRSSDPRVLFTSSQSGYFTKPFTGVYSASKFAIEAIADALRIELGLSGVKTILIEPGVIKTPIWSKSVGQALELEDQYDPERKKYYQQFTDKIADITNEFSKSGTEVREVSKIVLKAMTAGCPASRYRIGRDAKMYYWLSKFLPYRLRDKLINRFLRNL